MQAEVNYHRGEKLLGFINPIEIRRVSICFQLNSLFPTGSENILPDLDYKILLPVGITMYCCCKQFTPSDYLMNGV